MADTSVMIASPLETALWLGALAAAAHRQRAHLDGELAVLAEGMLGRWRAKARA